MTNEEVMQLMTDMGLHEGGMDDWVVDNAWVKFANAVAKHTLANIDPSSFMSWQEGYEAGKQTEREACANIAETPIGEYEVVVACGTEPAPHRIPQYANWQDIAAAIRARGQA